MCSPSLSPLERAAVAKAAELAASGVPVRWRVGWRRVWYITGGKYHMVTSAGTNRVFWSLVAQVKAEYMREAAGLAEQQLTGGKDEQSSVDVA